MSVVTTNTTARTTKRKQAGAPESYDFRRPMTLAREHARMLERAFETYARQWSMQLTSRLRMVSTIVLESVELTSYDEYVEHLDQHTVIVLLSLDDSRGSSLLEVPTAAVMHWIDLILGGPGLDRTEAPRDLTEIESQLITELLGATLQDLKYAFAAVHDFNPTIRGIQYSPQFVQAVPAQEAVLVAKFDMVVNGKKTPTTMMVPADILLTPMRLGEGGEARSAAELTEVKLAQERLEDAMEHVPLELAVSFRSTTVHPKEITELKLGQVIRLNHPVSRPLDITVENMFVGHGMSGTMGNQLACRVVDSDLGGQA